MNTNLEIDTFLLVERVMALLHKDLKVKTSHIYSNLSDNSGMWSA
ncbi:hypothetical protein J653_3837 [Acinetobacter baumannii 2887]|nr:hypothetical protein J653_3837 [Acinetobacter baumannii 2887]EXI26627.1 hypothetical protein J626_3687 [Acinetobacter baumannii 836190]